MKKCFFLLLLLLVFVKSSAQDAVREENPDKNNFDDLSHEYFNSNPLGNALMLNNVFMKSWIGINLDSIQKEDFNWISAPFVVRDINCRHDSIVVTQDPQTHPVVINGVEYKRFFNATTDREVELVTLDEIKEIYFPGLKDSCIFMVNKFFLTRDIQSYKFEKDFILRVELIKSEEFESLKGFPPFSIIQIFTKTRKNLIK